MTAMGIQKPVLIGNSMGCQVLADLAVRFPARVERLVLIGPTMDRTARTGVKQLWRLVRDTFREAPSQPFVVAYDYSSFGLRRFRQTFYDALADRIERKLPRIDVPVLVIRGARDPIAPRRWARELADLAPQARYAEVRDTAHTVNYMAPGALARAVRHFLRDVPYTGDRYATPRRENWS
jgi:pimeloyl-ACP methyl ester carboxylesterase